MPELPEVETIVRCLKPRLVGLTITGTELRWAKLLRNRTRSILRRLEGQRIISLSRRGKLIRLDSSGDLTLLLHLKMTGQLLFCRESDPCDKHTHFIVFFEGVRRELRFRDVRKFGFVRLLETREAERSAELRSLGPEPLELDPPSFFELFEGRRGRIKPLLLNQRIVAGIGNIYADEILFEARIHPQSEVSRFRPRNLESLRSAMRVVLSRAIKSRGTSIRDFRDGDGLRGGFQDFLCAYGRESLPCPRCGRRIKRLRIAGRSSFFCPCCQKQLFRRVQCV